jgi:hypothetical protein
MKIDVTLSGRRDVEQGSWCSLLGFVSPKDKLHICSSTRSYIPTPPPHPEWLCNYSDHSLKPPGDLRRPAHSHRSGTESKRLSAWECVWLCVAFSSRPCQHFGASPTQLCEF